MSSTTSFDALYISGQLLTSSGSNLFINGTAVGGGSSDPLGTAANTGQILYNDLTNLSGALNANISNTGQNLVRNITGAYINFVFRPSFGISGGFESQFIPFSGAFGTVPMVTYSIINGSSTGDAILGHFISGVTTNGFTITFSAAPQTSNYNICFMATTGQGFVYL
jgi:hypothetical protein